VFTNVPQSESRVQITNGVRGLKRVDIEVNNEHFRVSNLGDNEVRTLDIAAALLPGNVNRIVVQPHGPRGSSALLGISN
jgi:hypothetical protein